MPCLKRRKTSILCHRYPAPCHVWTRRKNSTSEPPAHTRTLDYEDYSPTFFIPFTFRVYPLHILHNLSVWPRFYATCYVQRDAKPSCQRILMSVCHQNGFSEYLPMLVLNPAHPLRLSYFVRCAAIKTDRTIWRLDLQFSLFSPDERTARGVIHVISPSVIFALLMRPLWAYRKDAPPHSATYGLRIPSCVTANSSTRSVILLTIR